MNTTTTDLPTAETDSEGTATPQWLFDALNEQVESVTGHRFSLDAAASAWNAKCADYFDREADALVQDWSKWQTVFCNPPFAAPVIEQFVDKAFDAAQKGSTVVLLLPVWPGYPWFQELKRQGHMQDVVGPTVFENADGTKVTFCNGPKSTNIVIVTLGPHIIGGTNGTPIRKPGAVDKVTEPLKTDGHKSTRRLKLLQMSEVEPRQTDWLWDGRIPLGELTILDGDPGSNKSSFLLDLAARVSSGREMIDETPGVSGGVILLLAEDSISKTVRRRLEVAGADLNRIAVIDQQVFLPRDLSLIEEAACRGQAKLIVIDPLMAFLAVDSNGDQKVRMALTPLTAVADRTNAAVVMVRHLTKRGGGHPLYRGSGSIGIIGATRSGLLIGRSPDDPDLRVLCQTKSNLGPIGQSLLFEPVDTDGVPQIEFRGECDYTPDDVLGPHKPNESRLAEATEFVTEILADGPVEQKEIKRQAVASGLAYRTVERAKEILGVHSEREGWGPGSKCWWRLPDEEVAQAEAHTTPTISVAFYGDET